MKWITLEQVKAQCRIEPDFTEEDALLTTYGNAAEQGILRLLERSWEDVCESLSREDIDGGLTIAALMLAEHLYKHRGPTENVSVSMVPYALDSLIKPFMRLTTDETQ
jgi:uncharacterized phage protein (predicted DNA packaging)